jgi:hypothetical protein
MHEFKLGLDLNRKEVRIIKSLFIYRLSDFFPSLKTCVNAQYLENKYLDDVLWKLPF